MASVLIDRERTPSSLAVAMPLAAPSADAAWAFLSDLVPATVLSSGSGRQRRKTATAGAMGKATEQGYLVFYRQRDPDRAPERVALKSPRSIKAYLRAQMGESADQWIALQTTQFRARRDGRTTADGFTTAQTRHILAIVVDLDGGRMAPMYRQLMSDQSYVFTAALDELLDAVGIESYRIVRSGPEGAHLYVPLIRPDGKPLRATDKTLADWERVAKGLARYLAQLGADANAVKPTQPFVIPGLRRQKHEDWIPYVTGGRDGARTDLYALLKRLAARKLVPAKERGFSTSLSLAPSSIVQEILVEIATKADGLSRGGRLNPARNQAAHDIAVYLLAKGATETAAWDALVRWNDRNDPPLRERELQACFSSALLCPGRHPEKFREMQRAPWRRLRGRLGLSTQMPAGYQKGGKWRPRTPAKPWELRKSTGGREHNHEVAERILRFVAGNGPELAITQAELADQIGAAVSTLKEALKQLQKDLKLAMITKRGRNGGMVLSIVELAVDQVTENSQSGKAPVGVKQGVRVGPIPMSPVPMSQSAQGAVGTGRELAAAVTGDPVGIAAEILAEHGVAIGGGLDWVAMWESSRCLLVARAPGDPLMRLFVDRGFGQELGRRLGGVAVGVRMRRTPSSPAAEASPPFVGVDTGRSDGDPPA